MNRSTACYSLSTGSVPVIPDWYIFTILRSYTPSELADLQSGIPLEPVNPQPVTRLNPVDPQSATPLEPAHVQPTPL